MTTVDGGRSSFLAMLQSRIHLEVDWRGVSFYLYFYQQPTSTSIVAGSFAPTLHLGISFTCAIRELSRTVARV